MDLVGFCVCVFGGGGGVKVFGYTKKMEVGWMCLEKCVETINGYLTE